jgi:hypothetical protein
VITRPLQLVRRQLAQCYKIGLTTPNLT